MLHMSLLLLLLGVGGVGVVDTQKMHLTPWEVVFSPVVESQSSLSSPPSQVYIYIYNYTYMYIYIIYVSKYIYIYISVLISLILFLCGWNTLSVVDGGSWQRSNFLKLLMRSLCLFF